MSSVADEKCGDMKVSLLGVAFCNAFYFAFYFWRR